MSTSTTNKDDYVSVSHRDGIDNIRTHRDPHRASRRSWRAPAMMLCTLLLGLGTAIAQHFFYTSLDGTPVSEVSVSQAWVSRISTGLAFLVKVALTLCVGAAFVQHQWHRLHQAPLRVAKLDTLTSALGNLFSFFEGTVLYRNPVLAVMAVVSWTLPLGTIVTPGALTVEAVRLATTPYLKVPQPYYNLTNYGTASSFDYQMNEDSRLTKMLAYTAASQGPVQLQSANQNQTYNLLFDGPAIKCGAGSDAATRNASFVYNPQNSPDTYDFACWMGLITPHRDEMGTLVKPDLDIYSSTGDSISVMTNVGPFNKNHKLYHKGNSSSYAVNITECTLYNATYDVTFDFHYPNQTRSIRITDWINKVTMLENGGIGSHDMSFDPRVLSYSAMMTAFGRLLVGSSFNSHYGTVFNEHTSRNMVSIDWSRAEAVQEGMEQLFQNFTLSLISDPALTKNSTLAALVPVDVEDWPLTYVYNRTDVFVAYGVSLLASLLCALVGFRAFHSNNASYQNLFSTYLRATSDAGLASYIQGTDAGDDPLPKSLAKAEVRLSPRREILSSMEEISSDGDGDLLPR